MRRATQHDGGLPSALTPARPAGTLVPMIVRTTITASSGDLRAEMVERDDHLFEVAVFARIHEHAPEFGVDEHVWHQIGRDKILTDTFERAVELAREEVER
jgi:hypothetical protein